MLPIGEYFTSFSGRQFHDVSVAEPKARSLMTTINSGNKFFKVLNGQTVTLSASFNDDQ